MENAPIESILKAKHWTTSGQGQAKRKALGLSAAWVAAQIPVDPSTLLRWESGRTQPRVSDGARWVAVIEAAEKTAEQQGPAS